VMFLYSALARQNHYDQARHMELRLKLLRHKGGYESSGNPEGKVAEKKHSERKQQLKTASRKTTPAEQQGVSMYISILLVVDSETQIQQKRKL